jgi:HAD superfamily hydrolase (TIGR01490 family)
MSRLVLFDLDGTLLPMPSAERRFARWLWQRGHIGILAGIRSLAFWAHWYERFGPHVWKKNKAYVAGLPVETVERWGREFAPTLRQALREDMVQALAEHQRRGDTVVLLTGASDFIAHPLADLLGVPYVVATELTVRRGRYTWEPPLRHPFGTEKIFLAQLLCERFGGRLRHITAYADSIHDRALLAAVGRPIAVHPDAPLDQVARARSWHVIDAKPA